MVEARKRADFNEIGVLQDELRRRLAAHTKLPARAADPRPMQNPKQLNLLINIGGALVGYPRRRLRRLCGVRHRGRAALQRALSGADALFAADERRQAADADRVAGARRDCAISASSTMPRSCRRRRPVGRGAGGQAAQAARRASTPTPRRATASNSAGRRRAWPAPRAACLTYSVWLPEKFAFGGGGVLPGVFGGEPAAPRQRAARRAAFGRASNGTPTASRRWRRRRRRRAHARSRAADFRCRPDAGSRSSRKSCSTTPGASRTASCGCGSTASLSLERPALPLRKDAKAMLTGVLVAIGYRARARPARHCCAVAVRDRLALDPHRRLTLAPSSPTASQRSPYQHTMRRRHSAPPTRKGRPACEMS